MPQKATRPSHDEIVSQDIRDLERLGYAQQLFREMGGFSNFAISFSIISVLTGAVLLYGYGLKFAGPIVNSVGWPLVSVVALRRVHQQGHRFPPRLRTDARWNGRKRTSCHAHAKTAVFQRSYPVTLPEPSRRPPG